MHRSTRKPTLVLAGCVGVLAALAVVTSFGQAATTTTTTATTAPPPPPKAAPKPKATTRTITCKASLVATKPLDRSAENFGTVTCSTPLGKGVSHDTSTIATTPATAGTFSGGVKLLLNTGTSADGIHSTLTEKMTLTFPPRKPAS